MNDNTSQFSEFVWRRLADPVRLFGLDLSPQLWLALLVVLLLAAFFYVGWMYVKDARGVGPWWAIFLGLLRSAVYVILATVFLLPAVQSWQETRAQSKVVVMFDVSGSMLGTIDDVPTGKPGEKLLSRQEKVLELLADDKVNFLPGLEKKNPITAYRFGKRLDEDFLTLADGRGWTREEWERRRQEADEKKEQTVTAPLSPGFLGSWLRPTVKAAAADDIAAAEKERLDKLAALNEKLDKAGIFKDTNLGASVLGAVNRELNGMVQGIVIFTDGRSTEGSPQAFKDLQERAKAARIPIFVVGVGSDRPQVKIEIVDLRVPQQVQPEDRFRAVVEVRGDGLPEKQIDVALELTHTKKGKGGKEEQLPILLIEPENKAAPSEKRETIDLGKRLLLKPPSPAKFDRSSPPRLEAEFPIDAATLAEAAGKNLKEGDYARKKWEIAETKEGEFRFRAIVPKDKAEVFADKEHASDKSDLRVLKKPMRVLLFASAPMRDYQFVRTLLVREVEKKRVELTIHLQMPPGKDKSERRVGVVQDVPPERLLPDFPNKLDAKDKEDRLYDLSEYDVIIAFDPDWTQLSDQQLKLLKRWVEEKGGGLVVVGGPINTVNLARPGAVRERLKGVLDLYPVNLKDVRVEEMDRTTESPWPLNLGEATGEVEFLKLSDEDNFQDAWKAFFFGTPADGGAPGTVLRGFYNFYPVDSAKQGTQILARFNDPRAKLKDGTLQPFIVMTDPAGTRRVVWIGSAETWRLRQYREAYHERFWTKLVRFAGAKSQGAVSRRIRLEMSKNQTVNKDVEVSAKIDGPGGEPLPRDAKAPLIKLTLPVGVAPKEIPTEVAMKPTPGRDGWYNARFQVRSAGEYDLKLEVPDTKDSTGQKFYAKEANPELDNTSPDFAQMYQLASEADEVLARMAEGERAALEKALTRPKGAAAGKPRLYFELGNAHLIPTCMVTDRKVQRSRGAIQDKWDDGWTVWAAEPPAKPVKVSWVLTAVVGLLSLEWLTRKLLRLA
ncbi:MAG TPA: hypothetical protein VFE78_12630 [Gemmataceae bacterium]|nr:hypothetical protein [Gemmataceae bacterium]